MLKYRVKNLEKLKRKFDPKIVDRANRAAQNKAAEKLRTYIKESIRDVYNVKAGAIAKRVKLNRASVSTPFAELSYTGPRIGLVNFGARAKKVTLSRKPRKGQKGRKWGRFRTGVTVKVRHDQGRKLVTKKGKKGAGFIAVGNNNNEQIFYRTGKGRNDLVSAKTWSIPEMVRLAEKEGGPSNESYQQQAAAEYDVEFDRAMRHFMSQAS